MQPRTSEELTTGAGQSLSAGVGQDNEELKDEGKDHGPDSDQ
jgi:hypothetical protein